MLKHLLSLFVCFICLAGQELPAMETDQYNLPPKPLVDIAPEVEAYVAQHIQSGLDKLNAEIAAHERCTESREAKAVANGPNIRCGTQVFEEGELARLRSPQAVAKVVYDELGTGTIFHARMGLWLTSHKFDREPARYTAPYSESIYITAPINYATLSPTIRVYGIEFGTDKFDHLFQQGYTYYRKYIEAKKEGKSDADALKKVVAYGRSTENLFFGYAVSGVYSNADLAANIAGLRFYQNLTSDVGLGAARVPPILTLTDGKWVFFSGQSPAVRNSAAVLRPFMTDHLNEALNPSNYLFFLYPIVKSVVKKNACPEWRAAFPMTSRTDFERLTAALMTWNSLDYGYKFTSRQVRIANVCFPEARASVSE